MSCTIDDIILEIEKWLYDHGYVPDCIYCLDRIYFKTSRKISRRDMFAFRWDFGEKLILEGIYQTSKGKKYEYSCLPPRLSGFRGNFTIIGKNYSGSPFF